MKIQSFDKASCRLVSEKVLAALATLEAELGVKFKEAGGTYSEGYYTMKLQCATVLENGVVGSPERTAYEKLAKFYELDPAMLDQEIVTPSGERFKITGLNQKSGKFPVVATKISDGRSYTFSAQAAKSAWERKTGKPQQAIAS